LCPPDAPAVDHTTTLARVFAAGWIMVWVIRVGWVWCWRKSNKGGLASKLVG
jgi:hypothetical protein